MRINSVRIIWDMPKKDNITIAGFLININAKINQ